jgi:hypothetical protein
MIHVYENVIMKLINLCNWREGGRKEWRKGERKEGGGEGGKKK